MTDVAPRIRVTDSPGYLTAEENTDDGGGFGSARRDARNNSAQNGRMSPTKSRPSTGITSRSGGQSNRTSFTVDKGEPTGAMDPLSQHILSRTNNPPALAQRLRTPTSNLSGTTAGALGDAVMDLKHMGESLRADTGLSYASKDNKKKGVSFFSRLIPNKKSKAASEDVDNESLQSENRPEGMDAQLFSNSFDNVGFRPSHPHPPEYIKVRARFKRSKEFDRVFLAQELRGQKLARTPTQSSISSGSRLNAATNDPIWAMSFSKDGKYLAAGGQDKVLRVWAVISTPEERRAHEKEEDAANRSTGEEPIHLSAPVFRKVPFREYVGHTSTILDLSWSKNNFILSSSMDKTVRLWHVSRPECLCTFKHSDFVPSIAFHPRDDRFFLAGSVDAKLRLWSIPDKSVALWKQLPDMITAVCFTPDGKTAIAGTLGGMCLFYDIEGLKYQTQIHVRSTRGANAKGSKITGIQAINIPPDSTSGEVKLLISSNDSRVRLYHLRDKSMEVKFKGHTNDASQIRASFSDDARYVICGSEDRKAYIWSTCPAEGEKRNHRPVELFEAHGSITTAALLAPQSTRQLLSASEDPVFDLCNPPPVTLRSRTESVASSKATNTEIDHSENTPASPRKKRATESPAYIARSAHTDGQIIVTADYTGQIKVFRQDCAFEKRIRASEQWDNASVFSKRVGGGRASIKGGNARTASIATRGSGASMRRSDSVSTQPPDDRIMSWRLNIASSGSMDSVAARSAASKRNARSVSPSKTSSPAARRSTTSINVASLTSAAQTPVTEGAPPSPFTQSGSTAAAATRGESATLATEDPKNPLSLQGQQSYAFWTQSTWRDQVGLRVPEEQHSVRLRKSASVVSALSSEDESEFESAEEGTRRPCRKCGCHQFRERKSGTYGLVCVRCATAVE